jgi:FkbM family methyltransferase
MATLVSNLFVSVARFAARLPRIKGKNGLFLRSFDALGLKAQHIIVETKLRAPTAYKVRLDLHSWLQRLAFISGEYEADTVTFLLKLRESINAPGSIFDIGANIGLIAIPTALMLKMRNNDHDRPPYVVCIEAVPDNVSALRHNIESNNMQDAISVIGTGLGEAAGTADIQVEGDLTLGGGTGTANVLPVGSTLDPNGTYECVRFPIQITTLDALMRSSLVPTKCVVVKIDTDGYDFKIIKGGRRFLEATRPVIYGEFSAHCLHWHGEGIADIVEFAGSLDYLVWQRLSGPDFAFTSIVDARTYKQDLMLVPSEYATRLAWCLRQGAP